MKIDAMAAVVTGGGSGLGAATVRALRAAGAKVAILDRDSTAAATVAAETGALGLGCDVTDEASVTAALDQAAAQNGEARILVNCAGIATGERIIGRDGAPMPLEGFRRVVEVNLIGTVNVMRLMAARAATLDPLETGERGVVVNTASVAAFEGQIGQLAYSASKGGVAAITLPAARELARYGIRVCTIAPGLFITPMLLGLPPEVQASLGGTVPFPNRLGDPSEYAALVRHIVENPMLNGETIRLDGALRMAPK